MISYFSLFSLPEQFAIDETQLSAHYRDLLAEYHPDKMASCSAFEQKQAMMMATTINDAYRVLREPLDRAAYLLQREGIDADDPAQTHFAEHFLLQQMQWRESLAEANNESEIHQLRTEVQAAYQDILQRLQAAFDQADFTQAASIVREGRFVQKLLAQINDMI